MLHYAAATQTLSCTDCSCLRQNVDAALKVTSHVIPQAHPSSSLQPLQSPQPLPNLMFYSIHGSACPQVLSASSLAFIGRSFDPMLDQFLNHVWQHLYIFTMVPGWSNHCSDYCRLALSVFGLGFEQPGTDVKEDVCRWR